MALMNKRWFWVMHLMLVYVAMFYFGLRIAHHVIDRAKKPVQIQHVQENKVLPMVVVEVCAGQEI